MSITARTKATVNRLIETDRQGRDELTRLLADVTLEFASSLNIDETLSHALDRFISYLDAEAGSIFLLDSDGTWLICRECVGPVNIVGVRLRPDEGIVGKTVQENAPQIVRDVSDDPNFAGSVDADSGFVTRSILCSPLTVRGTCIGALELINKRVGDGLFDTADVHLVSTIASAAALAIHNARMAQALVEQERVRKELELAREIQESLLPEPGDARLPVYGLNIPAREVSGDFFDYFALPDGRIYFNLADVSGKGMNAALLMAKTCSLLRCLAKTCHDAGKLLEQVNREICETASMGMFVTIISGYIDPAEGTICFANAGHQPALYRLPDGHYKEFAATAPPIGVLPDVNYTTERLPYGLGSLYFYTDGISESVDGVSHALEVSGLQDLIDAAADVEPAQRLGRMVEKLRGAGYQSSDDITLLLIENPEAARPGVLLRLQFDSDPRRLKMVREHVQECVKPLGCPHKYVSDLVIAVNEACMNIMQHAYKGSASGEIVLEIINNGPELVVTLTDFADPIDPGSVQPRDIEEIRPGGLGTYFIREIMDDCTYGHLNDECGNVLRMRKRIS